MATLTSQLVIELMDRVTAPARRASRALAGISKTIRETNDTPIGFGDRLDAAITRNNRALARARGGMIDAAASFYGLREAIGAPLRAASDFESAMADVRKVVDFPTPEGFAKFQKDLFALSREIPIAVTGLADIAAAAGQAGIAGQDLVRFTEAASKIGVAFDISADQAGASMANLMTALDLTIDETVSLADAMNHLSNSQASSAADILDVVRRVGAQAKMFGFTAEETSAFASAMLAAGAESNVAATSFRNMGAALTKGTAATKGQRTALKELGLDAVDVAKKMQEDAVGTTIDVLKRIGQLPKEQQAAISTKLFGNEARALGPLLTNLDLVRETLGMVGDEAKYAGSAFAEFEARNKTFAANMQRFQNVMTELKVGIGNALMPAISSIAEAITPLVMAISDLANKFPWLTTTIVGATTAVIGFKAAVSALQFVGLVGKGGLLSMLSAGFTAVGGAGRLGAAGVAAMGRGLMAVTIAPLIGGLRRARAAMIAFSVAANTVGTGGALKMVGASALSTINPLGLLKGAFTAATIGVRALGVALITNPIGAVLAALAAAGLFVYRNWAGLKEMWLGFKEAFLSALEPVMPTLQPVIDIVGRVAGAVGNLIPKLDASSEQWRDWGRSVGEVAASIVKGTAEFFAAGVELIQSLWDGAVKTFNSFIEWVTGIPGRIVDAIGNINLSDIITWPSPPQWWQDLWGGGDRKVEVTNPASEFAGVDGSRARGGPISRGGAYWTSENGPELITARRSGYVHPSERDQSGAPVAPALPAEAASVAPVAPAALGQVDVSINAPITVTGADQMDPQELAAEVSRQMRDQVREAFRGVFADTGMRFA